MAFIHFHSFYITYPTLLNKEFLYLTGEAGCGIEPRAVFVSVAFHSKRHLRFVGEGQEKEFELERVRDTHVTAIVK